MKKTHYLFVFIVCYVLIVFLAREPLITVYQYKQISKSPAQTAVTKTALITDGEGDFQGYWVDFFYRVDGKDYHFRSLDTSQKIANAYMTQADYKNITYASHSPDIAMLTYHYQLRQKEKPEQMIGVVLISSAVVALLLTLLVAFVVFLRNRRRNK